MIYSKNKKKTRITSQRYPAKKNSYFYDIINIISHFRTIVNPSANLRRAKIHIQKGLRHMLAKEKTKLDHETCYLLGENKLGYGLIYLVETTDYYELIYRDKDGYINQIDTGDGYRLYEPNELYHLIEEFVISDLDITLFNERMYEYHAALSAKYIAGKLSRFRDDKLYKYYDDIMNKIRIEISKLLSPEGEENA